MEWSLHEVGVGVYLLTTWSLSHRHIECCISMTAHKFEGNRITQAGDELVGTLEALPSLPIRFCKLLRPPNCDPRRFPSALNATRLLSSDRRHTSSHAERSRGCPSGTLAAEEEALYAEAVRLERIVL